MLLGATFDSSSVDRFLNARAADGTLSGVVLVAENGEVVYERAFGYAEYELGTPMSKDSSFRIASVTKLVTAAAVMRLADRGALKLETSVCDFLRNCPASWRAVTIANLLDHSSGIPDLFESIPAAPLEQTVSAIDTTVAAAKPADLIPLGPPGTTVAYSNFDYMLLGYAIERQTNETWIGAVEREVSAPLGMTSTVYDDPWALISSRVRGYTLGSTYAVRNTPYKDDSAYATGGLLSRAADLNAFTSAMTGPTFLSERMRSRAFTPNSGGFGYGWQVTHFWDKPVFDLSGGTDGFTSHVAYYPDQRLTVIVLANVDSGRDAISVSCDIAALIFGESYPVLERFHGNAALDSSVAGTYAGKRVVSAGAAPAYEGTDGTTHRLIPISPFAAALADAQDVRLTWSPGGKVMTATSCGRHLYDAAKA